MEAKSEKIIEALSSRPVLVYRDEKTLTGREKSSYLGSEKTERQIAIFTENRNQEDEYKMAAKGITEVNSEILGSESIGSINDNKMSKVLSKKPLRMSTTEREIKKKIPNVTVALVESDRSPINKSPKFKKQKQEEPEGTLELHISEINDAGTSEGG